MMTLDSRLDMSSYTLKLHTKAHTFVCVRPTLKNVERFRNGSNLMRDHEQSIVNYAISNELSTITLKQIPKHCRVSIRDREPSRIPIRIMERLKNKSTKAIMFVYERIRLTIPKSSKLYCYVRARKQKK